MAFEVFNTFKTVWKNFPKSFKVFTIVLLVVLLITTIAVLYYLSDAIDELLFMVNSMKKAVE